MKSAILEFNGLNTIGVYAFCTNKFLLLGREVPEKYDDELKRALGVEIKRITIAGTSLIGAFLVGDEEKILVPEIIYDDELESLKELGVEVQVVKSRFTCLGNNVVLGKNKVLVNPEVQEDEAKLIAKHLGKDLVQQKLMNTNSVGSLMVSNNSRCLASNQLSEDEIQLVESLGLEVTTGSVNMGSPHIRTGVIVNQNGFVIGKGSGGPEIVNAEEALKNE